MIASVLNIGQGNRKTYIKQVLHDLPVVKIEDTTRVGLNRAVWNELIGQEVILATPAEVRSGQVRSGQVRSGQVRSLQWAYGFWGTLISSRFSSSPLTAPNLFNTRHCAPSCPRFDVPHTCVPWPPYSFLQPFRASIFKNVLTFKDNIYRFDVVIFIHVCLGAFNFFLLLFDIIKEG